VHSSSGAVVAGFCSWKRRKLGDLSGIGLVGLVMYSTDVSNEIWAPGLGDLAPGFWSFLGQLVREEKKRRE
jgi:hypothetical protein